MIKKVIANITKQREAERRATLHRNLIRHEAKIGGQLFGPVPHGHRREFFCLDERTWVWHEEWVDHSGVTQSLTTRYDVRPDAIYKVQNGQYKPVSKAEAKRLVQAAEIYKQRVDTELYAGVA
jgi:hypothetical protein